MPETAARLLALLSLLQARPTWPGPELAGRLAVSTRTIRNDVERLRTLGYPIEAVRGSGGHYRLGAGATMPPLLLDDEEAVAVAVGLRAATGLAGIEESGARALAKLEQVLPGRLRRKVTAVSAAVAAGPENTTSNVEDPVLDPEVLSAVALAIRDRHWLRFTDRGEPVLVEPHRLVSWQRRWYLVGRAPDTGRWAAHRVDRMQLRPPTGRRFDPQPPPEGGYTDFVLREVASTGWDVHARITVHAPAGEVLARINAAVGVVESVDEETCVLVTGADSLETVAVYVGMLGLDFTVTSPPALVDHVAGLADRYARAVGRPSRPRPG
ncbi:helix-turn-helix transcriptional regulator [Geodermatophilus sp. SYSU D01119]